MLEIETKLSMAFHLQTDGQIERMNQELEQYFCMFIDHQQEQWPEWLGTAEFAYNNKVHTGTKVLPFKANQGQDLRIGFEMRKKGKYEGAEKFLERIRNVQEEAKAALQKAQDYCNETTGKLGHPQRRIILFLFHFLLLCNSLKCVGHYDSKGVCGIIQVDKY